MGAFVINRNGQPHLDFIERGMRTIQSATQNKVLLSDDSVTLRVVSNSVLDIRINDYFTVFGDFYRINQLPTVQKINESRYEYDIVGQGLMFDLLRCKFFNADATGFKTDTEFPFIGTLEHYLLLVKNNMARFSSKWEIGTLAGNTETKSLTFSDDTCLSALQKICNEFKTEFWVKNEGEKFKIHTGNFGSTIPVTFPYGKGKGLYSLTRRNVDESGVINRLYVSGGDKNLPNGYRNGSRTLKLPGAEYLEDAAAIAANGLKEGSITFEEVYPRRTGVVGSVTGLTKFVDTTMDFDLNAKEADGITTKYLIPGTSAKIKFNKGNLAGYQFEVHKYNHATKEFEIIPFQNESGQKFPDADSTAFQINAGDEYVLLDIIMPHTYETNAENELQTKAQPQFEILKQAKVSYDLQPDPRFMEGLPQVINIGDLLKVQDTPLGIDKVIRVTQVTRDFIQNGTPTPFDMKIVIADSYQIAYSSQMVMQQQQINTILNLTQATNFNFSKIGYNATKELRDKIFDPDGYFDGGKIKPGSIETGMLSVGAQTQELSCTVVFQPNSENNPNKIQYLQGELHNATNEKTWHIDENMVTIPDNGWRYVFALCPKSGTGNATIEFSQTQYKTDENPNHYYYLLGILHSVVDGERILSITIGSTTIIGGLIRTGIIQDAAGKTQFNLNTGELKGKITFTNDSPALGQVSAIAQAGDAQVLTQAQAAAANLQNQLNTTNQTLANYSGITQAQQQNINNLINKTNFLSSTTISGNAIATGSLIVGNDQGANAGITGLGSSQNGVFLWGGGDYNKMLEGKAKREMRRDGVDIWRHVNGQVGIRIGMINGFPEMSFYKDDGTKVYALGQNGIYYVAEVPESFTFMKLLSLQNNSEVPNIEQFKEFISNKLFRYNSAFIVMNTDTDTWQYNAGQNPSSEINKQYEGYKKTQDKYDNVVDGWYAFYQEGGYYSQPQGVFIIEVFIARIVGGKAVNTLTIEIPTTLMDIPDLSDPALGGEASGNEFTQ